MLLKVNIHVQSGCTQQNILEESQEELGPIPAEAHSVVLPLSLLRYFELEEASDALALHPTNKQILPHKHQFHRAADYFLSNFRSHINVP